MKPAGAIGPVWSPPLESRQERGVVRGYSASLPVTATSTQLPPLLLLRCDLRQFRESMLPLLP